MSTPVTVIAGEAFLTVNSTYLLVNSVLSDFKLAITVYLPAARSLRVKTPLPSVTSTSYSLPLTITVIAWFNVLLFLSVKSILISAFSL